MQINEIRTCTYIVCNIIGTRGIRNILHLLTTVRRIRFTHVENVKRSDGMSLLLLHLA